MNYSDIVFGSFAMIVIAAAVVICLLGDTTKRTAYMVTLLIIAVIATGVAHNLQLGKALSGGHLKHGQTYEVYHRFNIDGTTVVYLAPVAIHIADGTYSRISGELPRFYVVGGFDHTNNIVIAFSEGSQGWLRAIDGTNNFRLVAE